MRIVINDVYIPLLYDKTRIILLKGGAGSGKSVFACQKLIHKATHEFPCKILALRKVARTLRHSIFEELKSQISEMGIYGEWQINKSDMTFTHDSGTSIILSGMDDPEKVKSISGVTGVFMEEMTEFSEEDFNQLDLRLRNRDADYLQIIGSFNPISEDSWIKRRFFDRSEPECKISETTYKDNHYLPDGYIERLERLKDVDQKMYDIYCLGKWGLIDTSNKFASRFEESVNVAPVEWVPTQSTYISFDFNVNPITAIAGQFTTSHDIRIFKEWRLSNSDIYELCDEIKTDIDTSNVYVTGDASGRGRQAISKGNVTYYEIIQTEMNLSPYQLDVPRSNPSVDTTRVLLNSLLKNGCITIDPSCKHLINDLKYVKWEKGKIVKTENTELSHLLDTLRYFVSTYHDDYIQFR